MAATAEATKSVESVLQIKPARVHLALERTSFDEKTGEMEVLWHNEGFRFSHYIPKGYDGYERVIVELSFDASAIRKERLDRGVPVLHEHGFFNSGLKNTLLGRTTGWKLEGSAPKRRAVATVRFTKREDADTRGVLKDIQDGILAGVSGGISLHKLEATGEAVNGVVVYQATSWEPFEISFVASARDPNAESLSKADDSAPCIVLRLPSTNVEANAQASGEHSTTVTAEGSTLMAAKAGDAADPAKAGEAGASGGAATVTADKGPDVAALAAKAASDALLAERKRTGGLVALAREHRLDDVVLDKWRDGGTSVADAQVETLSILKERQDKGGLPATGGFRVGQGAADRVALGIEHALMLRVSGGMAKLDDAARDMARPFVHLTLLEQARAMLSARGKNVEGLGRKEVALLALGVHGPSDFPKALENVQQKFLQGKYDAAETTFDKLAKVRDAVDFKQMSTVHIGLGAKMNQILVGEPIRFGTIGEGGEKFAVKRYGVGYAFDVTAIVNDDLSALDVLSQFGTEGRLLPNRLAWALITSNATMADGVAVFHGASHKNDLATGSTDKVLGEDGLSALRKLLRLQVDPDLKTLNLRARFLVVPAALETTAKKLVAQFGPTKTGDVNTFAGTEVLIEAELDTSGAANAATTYFLVTDPMQLPGFEVAYLDGQRIPKVATVTDFDSGAIKVKAEMEVGVTVPNHRGWSRSTGTTA